MDFPLGGIASVLGVLEAVLALVDTASLAHEARRKHRYLEHVKILILDTGRDVEQAREDKKEASRVWSREERDCQRQECHGEIRWFRLSRNISRVMVLYPACMLVMSNYAATRGLLQGCDRLESRPLEHQISTIPQCILQPSPLTFFTASVVWTVSEYVHFQSSATDGFQKHVLGSAVVVGLLLCVSCASSALGVLIYTMPWIIHVGLLVSGFLHVILGQKFSVAALMVFPCNALAIRP